MKKNINFGIICATVSIFMYHVNIWSSLPVWNLFIIALYSGIAIYFFKNRTIIVTGYLKWCIVLVGIAVIVSAINTYSRDAYINIINMCKIMIPAYIIVVSARTDDRRKDIFWGLFIAGIMVAIELMLSFDMNAVIGAQYLSNTRQGLGGIEHPNTTGYNILLSIFSGVCLFEKAYQKKEKILLIVGEIVLLIGVILTGSRKVLFIIIIAAILLVISSSRNPLKTGFKLLILGVFAFVLYQIIMNNTVTYNIIGNRIESLFNGNDESSNGREGLVIDAIKVGFNSIIGVGWGNYSKYNTGGFYAHNEYCEVFAGIGMIGLLVYYVPIFNKAYHLLRRIIKNNRKEIYYTIAIICVLITDYSQVTSTLYCYHIWIALLLTYSNLWENQNREAS